MTDIWKFGEYGKYCVVRSFHVDEPLDANRLLESLREASTDLDVQVVDLDSIAGRKHFYFAMLNTIHSFRRETNISRSLAVEFLLFASTQKQISEAIKMVGVDEKTRHLAIIAIGTDEDSVRRFAEKGYSLTNARSDDSLPDRWSKEKIENLLSTFKISKKELDAMSGKDTPVEETIQKLILERMALLPTMV